MRGRMAWMVASLAALAACGTEPDVEDRWRDLRRWEDTRTLAGDSLVALLDDGRRDLRAATARALGRIGHRDGMRPLIRALDDATAEVRREAAFGLGILGDDGAVGSLIARLDREPDIEATAQLCLAIGRLGGRGSAEFLHPMLRSDYPRIREATAEALALLADSTSVAPLLRATRDSVPGVVWRAAYALEKVPDPSSHDRLLELARHEFDLVRRYAVRSLGRIGAEDAAPAIAALAVPGHANWHLRVRAADSLGRLGVLDPAIEARVRALLRDPVFHVRVAALQAIGHAGWSGLTDALAPAAADTTVDVRAARLETLAALDRAAHAEAFVAARRDPSVVVRATGVRYDVATGSPAALRRARADLEIDRPRTIRMAAVQGLSDAGVEAPADLLLELLRDPDVLVATVAAGALGERDDVDATGALIAASHRTDDPSGELRRAVFTALGHVGSEGAKDRLREALDSETATWLRLAARNALHALAEGDAERMALPDERTIRLTPRPVRRDPTQPARVVRSTAAEIVLRTRHGDMIIRPFGENAPQMVENFARLGSRGFFDGLNFHRVVPDFVVQGGDPTGTGWGDAGYTIRSEWNRRSYERGTVGIAHSGKDTGSCQLFITHAPQPHLDARYTIWGEVIDGKRIVDAIQRGDSFEMHVTWADGP